MTFILGCVGFLFFGISGAAVGIVIGLGIDILNGDN